MLNSEQIASIADHLDRGFNCYYHIQTFGVVKIPKLDLGHLNEEAYEADMEELEQNFMEYQFIPHLPKQASYEMMIQFVNSLPVNDMNKTSLLEALNKPKPFKHFKEIVKLNEAATKMWLNYRLEVYAQWIDSHIK